jgi:drug/metabolite transporter (DMT)-like permease
MTAESDTRPWQVQFAVLAAIWGSSFLLIKVSDESFTPLQVALGRVVCGTLALVAIALVRRERLAFSRQAWLHLAVAALLFNSIPFALFAWGETRTSSVLAGIWNAATPLFTLPFALLLVRGDRPSRMRVASVGLGFVGVLVVLGLWRGTSGGAFVGNLACVGAAACYGLGFAYTRRFLSGGHSPVALATGQLLCATVELSLVTLPLGHAPHAVSLRSTASVVTLGALGTGIAYALNYGVIRAAGITVASTVTYIVPVFSTVLGVAVLSEPLRWNAPVGGAIVLAAAALAQNRHAPIVARWRLRSAT